MLIDNQRSTSVHLLAAVTNSNLVSNDNYHFTSSRLFILPISGAQLLLFSVTPELSELITVVQIGDWNFARGFVSEKYVKGKNNIFLWRYETISVREIFYSN